MPPDNAGGTIGQGIHKLPSKNPSPHVAKEPTPVGGLNSKGQRRYIDPTTGKDAYISLLTPRVKGPRGLPIKG